ncbi:related to monooxigenase [Fusarium fujikuroi]|nr:related to monooxigenase [Fusarium fujikuroi]SCO15028.1 related to monooxigenase [Fusarium fujikuroi]
MDPSPTAFIPKPLRIIVIGAGLKCDVFILATGRLNNWKLPDIEGLNKFQGSVIHTADWQSGLDYRGKDIAVIGNGASSTQCLAKLSKDAKSIGNFIRGPTYLVPHVFSYNGEPQVNYSKDTIEEFENNPSSYLRFRQQLEQKLAHSFKGLWAESKAAEEFTQTAKQHMIKKIEDPHALEALLPTDYKAGCRRFTPADMYMEALNQSNVELISTPIKLMEGDAIITSDGKRRTYDIIVCGTGFEPYTPRFPIKGRGVADLSELWSMDGGYESYLAATVAGFPNFFDKIDDFGVEEQVADTLALQDLLDVNQFLLMSRSHGGWVGLELAARMGKERVKGLLMIDQIGITMRIGFPFTSPVEPTTLK